MNTALKGVAHKIPLALVAGLFLVAGVVVPASAAPQTSTPPRISAAVRLPMCYGTTLGEEKTLDCYRLVTTVREHLIDRQMLWIWRWSYQNNFPDQIRNNFLNAERQWLQLRLRACGVDVNPYPNEAGYDQPAFKCRLFMDITFSKTLHAMVNIFGENSKHLFKSWPTLKDVRAPRSVSNFERETRHLWQ